MNIENTANWTIYPISKVARHYVVCEFENFWFEIQTETTSQGMIKTHIPCMPLPEEA